MQVSDPPAQPAVAAKPTTVPNAAQAIFHVLRDWGVELLFTCPGSTEAAVLDASLDHPDVRTILVTHESIAVSAADGYGRVTGKPAVAYLHANVGLANGVAHVACASLSNSPVVVLNGIKSTVITNRGGFTTAPFMTDHMRQYTRLARVAVRSDGIADDLTRALRAATTDPGGPVYLGLPQDLVEATTPIALPDAARRRVASRRRPDPDAVAAAARLLAGASAVTIVAGTEIAVPAARAALLALAERLDAPVVLEDRRTIASAGIPGDSPAFAGSYGLTNPAVTGADVLLFAGMPSFTEFEPPLGAYTPANAKTIHLSSDPAEVAKVEGMDIGLAGNATLALRDLLAAVGDARSDARRAHRDAAVAADRAATAKRRTELRARYGESPIHPMVLMEALDEILPRDCTVVNDAVTSGGYLNESLLPGSAREMLTITGGSLGWAMGASIGVQLAKPGARVVCAVGDGAFQFGIQSLHTAAALRLPIVHIVIDNASYAAVKAAIKRYRVRSGTTPPANVFAGSEIAGPDIAAISRGFGAFAETVTQLSDLRGAVERALAFDGPSVVVVKTDTAHTGP